jgi:PIN domain nuclease of toxin-antitoxin system
MGTAVVDASAVLALLRDEPGAAGIAALEATPMISAVNLLEVRLVMRRQGVPEDTVAAIVDALHLRVVPFVGQLIPLAAAIHAAGRRKGLSLADAICLATAQALQLPVYTADRAWRDVVDGVEVRWVR